MNEFTKEELEHLGLALDSLYVHESENEMHIDLLNRIESMIDNYCEHDTSGGEVELFIDTCSKCNAFILRESYY